MGTSLPAIAKLRQNIIPVERFPSIGFGNGGEKSSLIGIIELEGTLFREEDRYRRALLQRLTLHNDLTSHDFSPSYPHSAILPRTHTTINEWMSNHLLFMPTRLNRPGGRWLRNRSITLRLRSGQAVAALITSTPTIAVWMKAVTSDERSVIGYW
ncbi:MAG: hypothetical protein A3J28_01220 [Acidobacteria bacterium RIFCSPLOWO2_12_FULL_60_22]|nr:MAG: hypothetical protein A3J28_01220 [Acidobacteria bacterium RIFCSPLOWO2_12_FULL_60_22]